ncbi:MAG: LTA synthase family protein [Acidobacteria bacterium]|nr:LTA synthase family protein [Acidobacteriota bacterium]
MTSAQLLLIVAAGWGLTLVLESYLTLRPQLSSRPAGAYAIHLGLWLLLVGVPLVAFQRPLLVLVLAMAFWVLMVTVSNVKHDRLKEPLIFTDFEFVSYAMRHPRLYVPFFGVARFLLYGGVAFAAAFGLWRLEQNWRRSLPDAGLAVFAAGSAILGAVLVWAGGRIVGEPTLDPVVDLRRYGLVANFWLYRRAKRRPRVGPVPTPFSAGGVQTADRPDIVAIQSESFFDVRRLYAGVRPDVLENFDAIRRVAAAEGRLLVPAWGANTVRTEFSFLSGLASETLGIDRFNPYRWLARRPLVTLVGHLRGLGYRTVCVHPYLSSFYARDEVFPHLGFDEIVDVRSFSHGDRFGPYVSDAAVAATITRLVDQSDRPVFVFAITMENHGPLHLESVRPGEAADFMADLPPSSSLHDLTVYLRHLKNADRMLATLKSWMDSRSRPVHVCWYGDHVPIMPHVYDAMRPTSGDTDYLLWSNRRNGDGHHGDVAIEALGPLLLTAAGLMPGQTPAPKTHAH